MSEMRGTILVWDFPTRTFHWLLALSFAGAYATADLDGDRVLHALFGYTVAGLLAFRLFWAAAGTRYARWSGFTLSLRAAADYVRALVAGRPQHYVGHNPLGSWSAVALLAILAAATASGVGLLFEIGGDAMEELHEALANAVLALVMVHVAGVLMSSAVHRENLVHAMVTGTKRGQSHQAAGASRPLVALALIVVVAAFWAGGFGAPGLRDNPGLIAAAMQADRGDHDDDDDDD